MPRRKNLYLRRTNLYLGKKHLVLGRKQFFFSEKSCGSEHKCCVLFHLLRFLASSDFCQPSRTLLLESRSIVEALFESCYAINGDEADYRSNARPAPVRPTAVLNDRHPAFATLMEILDWRSRAHKTTCQPLLSSCNRLEVKD